MPQFELVNFAPQFVWMVIAFAILYFGIVRATLPKLGRTIDARDGKVKGDIAAARAAKAEADRMAADYDAGVASAQEQARARLEAVRRESAAALEAKLADSNAVLHARAAEADASLAAARQQAMARIEDVAADAAADIVEKLTGARPSADEAVVAARAALA